MNPFNIPEERRSQDFGDLIPYVIRARPLPDIYDLENNLPGSIKVRVNRLYKKLANLDYRKRNVDFQQIFTEISICEIILANEAKYRRLVAFRRKMHGDN